MGMNIQGSTRGDEVTQITTQTDRQEAIQDKLAKQVSSNESLQASQEEVVNPFAAKFATKQKEIKTEKSAVQKMKESGETGEMILPIAQIKDAAEQFQRRNPELKSNVLVDLRKLVKPGDSKEDILKKIANFFPDPFLADEALQFLLKTTDGDLAETVKQAKSDFEELHKGEIKAGQYISTKSWEAQGKGLGKAESMLDIYRDIKGNSRDSTTLFEELSKKYAYSELKTVIDFLLHSLGSDLKKEGYAIPHGLLHKLITETRSLQAILGVYKFTRGRMRLIDKMFNEQGLTKPAELTFENIAKQFMSLAQDRSPSSARVSQTASKLGIENSVVAKIIVFSQMRDGVREVAMNQIFKTVQHRDELYLSILETLEDLEDQLEDMQK